MRPPEKGGDQNDGADNGLPHVALHASSGLDGEDWSPGETELDAGGRIGRFYNFAEFIQPYRPFCVVAGLIARLNEDEAKCAVDGSKPVSVLGGKTGAERRQAERVVAQAREIEGRERGGESFARFIQRFGGVGWIEAC